MDRTLSHRSTFSRPQPLWMISSSRGQNLVIQGRGSRSLRSVRCVDGRLSRVSPSGGAAPCCVLQGAVVWPGPSSAATGGWKPEQQWLDLTTRDCLRRRERFRTLPPSFLRRGGWPTTGPAATRWRRRSAIRRVLRAQGGGLECQGGCPCQRALHRPPWQGDFRCAARRLLSQALRWCRLTPRSPGFRGDAFAARRAGGDRGLPPRRKHTVCSRSRRACEHERQLRSLRGRCPGTSSRPSAEPEDGVARAALQGDPPPGSRSTPRRSRTCSGAGSPGHLPPTASASAAPTATAATRSWPSRLRRTLRAVELRRRRAGGHLIERADIRGKVITRTTPATLITRRCGADYVFPVKGARNLRRHRLGASGRFKEARPASSSDRYVPLKGLINHPGRSPASSAAANRWERAPAAQRAATTVHHHLARCATRVARGTAAAAGRGKHEPPRLRLRRRRLPDPQTAPASTTSRSR